MLPKKNRLDRNMVEKIFKEGRFVNSANLSFKFILPPRLPTSPQPSPCQGEGGRISFITPKTASKKAVVRNLLRRRGYNVLKKHFSIFPAGFAGAFIFGKKSVVVFGGRKNKIYNPIQNLEAEVKNILSKIRF